MEVDKTRNNNAPLREETHPEQINGVVQPPMVPSLDRPGCAMNQLQSRAQDYSIFCDLPPEMLNRIFGNLQLEDRKSVRLVCKLWYQCSTCPSITQNEKIVFRINSGMEDIAEIMQKSNFSNLEFQGLSITYLPANIWEVCGSKIRSLEFMQCYADDETIKKIIIHCGILISFTWITKFRKDIFLSSQLLNDLVQKGVERKSLRSFTLMMCDPLGEIVLNKLFLVYPCIIHFAAETIPHQWFSYFPISLESLTFRKVLESKHWMKAYIERAEQGYRLKHLNAIFDLEGKYKLYAPETLLKFFRFQKNLETVTLRLLGCRNQQVMKKITFNILGSCPNLQEFHILFGDDRADSQFLYFNREELLRLHALISKLKRLTLGICVSDDESNIPPPRAPTTLFSGDLALTSLDLRSNSNTPRADRVKNQNLYAALIQRCPQLLHLKMEVAVDSTLQVIFKNLLKLQTLSVCDCHCTSYGFTGRNGGYSIKRLQQLKFLDIYDIGEVKHFEEIIPELEFPNLEYFKLDWEIIRKLPRKKYMEISSLLPNLRVLEIIHDGLNKRSNWIVQLVHFVKNFTKLYYLNIMINAVPLVFKNSLKDQVENFRQCSSLRYITNEGGDVFYLNPITKEITRFEDACLNKQCIIYNSIFDNVFLN